jgi:hypothetical protein
MNLQQIKGLFKEAGVKRLYAKKLAPNDNSKNQPYFGPDFQSLNIFPTKEVAADGGKHLKAKLDFGWLMPTGEIVRARHAQLIFYTRHQEVRFSGFLKDCNSTCPEWNLMRSLMNLRAEGRILYLGVTELGEVLGVVVGADSPAASESTFGETPDVGVFHELAMPWQFQQLDSRTILISELGRIHRKGWIDSKQLNSLGRCGPCNAPQCGGFTLEAELQIAKNSHAEPDYLGWEIKQHSVTNFSRPASARPITMLTPEPTGGFYRDHGLEAFIREFGYKDRTGREDRLNFGGRYFFGKKVSLTGLRLMLDGYDAARKRITNTCGSIVLLNDEDVVAASWDFAGIIAHWSRKHAKAAYVPSMMRVEGINQQRQYCYGSHVRLAEQTDSLRLFDAIASGRLYYDPGIKMEQASSENPKIKPRSQWRVGSKDIGSLYEKLEVVAL